MTHTASNGVEKRVDGAVASERTRYVGVRMPQDLYQRLVDLAKRERRSLNAQVVVHCGPAHTQSLRAAKTNRRKQDRCQTEDNNNARSARLAHDP